MPQNTIKQKLVQIDNDIDGQVERINRLLALLNPLSTNRKSTFLPLTGRSQTADGFWPEGKKVDDCCGVMDCTQEEDSQSESNYVFCSLEEEDEILLNGYSNCLSCQYVESLFLSSPKTLQVGCQFNWISNYLDRGDCIVKLNNPSLQILAAEGGKLLCQNEQGRVQSSILPSNSTLTISFPRHLRGYRLQTNKNDSDLVYELQISQSIRLLIQVIPKNKEVQRVLVLKEEDSGQYSIAWGQYSQQKFIESLLLEAGKYIILPLAPRNCLEISIYFQDQTSISLKMAFQTPQKTFNLLISSLEECKSTGQSSRSFQGQKREYTRFCHMDIGIVVEIFENIHRFEALFLNEEHLQQDLQLLFPTLYSASQQQHRFSPGEKSTQLSSISATPARLFVPRKQVLTGNRITECQAIHSIFQ